MRAVRISINLSVARPSLSAGASFAIINATFTTQAFPSVLQPALPASVCRGCGQALAACSSASAPQSLPSLQCSLPVETVTYPARSSPMSVPALGESACYPRDQLQRVACAVVARFCPSSRQSASASGRGSRQSRRQ